nr:ubiquitin-protein ligase UBE3B [Haemonchus contortus]
MINAVVVQIAPNFAAQFAARPDSHEPHVPRVCREDRILRQLWSYLVRWGGEGRSSSPSTSPPPLTAALALLARPQSPHAAPLTLFADAAAIVISILDEEELYERAVPFPLDELVHIARFCNYFCFRAVWSGYVGRFCG